MTGIILFDGICNFCNNSVQFIIKRDPHAYFKFASLQSDIGKRLLKEYGLHDDIDSFVLIEKNSCYLKSSAAIHVCKHLKGMWKLLYMFRFIPPPIRNIAYDIIARNRYKWFGKKESCMLPSKEERERFLQ
ncbi:thiol-disulfide oxidoreductase DCC family protein [Heyndrickxia sporothermodurans]